MQQQQQGPSYSKWEHLAAKLTPSGLAWLASNRTYRLPNYLAYLDEKLLDLAYGRISRLMVTMPPRSGKSELCSKYYPAWLVGALQKRVILCSYEAQFASSWGRKARDILEQWGKPLYGVSVSNSSSAANWWELSNSQGMMSTAGVGGPITGKGGNVLIIDDPVKNSDDARSKLFQEKQWDWYQSTLYTRREPGASILLIMTRWNEGDLAGRLLDAEKNGGEHWERVNFEALASRDEFVPLAGGKSFSRKEGDPLWPERFSKQDMLNIKEAVGTKVWTSLYMQNPSPEEGAIWKVEWFSQRYDVLPQLKVKIQTIDSAFKTGVGNDYSVIATWGMAKNGFYLIDIWRMKVEYPDLYQAIIDQFNKHDPRYVIIEDAASAQSAIQQLKRETMLPILPVHPAQSKIARAEIATPYGEAKRIFLPNGGIWISDWIEEHVTFPNGKHDDCVDTTSLAIETFITKFKARQSFEEYIRRREQGVDIIPA